MSDPTEAIAQALEAHWLHHDNRCRCDKDRKVLTGAEWRAHVTKAVVDALTANGWALTELPEPDDTGSGKDGDFDAWWGTIPRTIPTVPHAGRDTTCT